MTTLKANDSEPVLHFLVREPKVKTEKPPVLILLHGVGSNETDLFSFAGLIPDEYLVISARAPITLSKERYAWYHVDFSAGKPHINFEEHEKSRALLIDFINQIKKQYALVDNHIILGGFSQGAIMSYSVALTNPELVSGIAILSGRLLEEIKPLVVSKNRLKTLKVFISHGISDATLPIQYARDAVSYLKLQEVIPSFNEYPVGHTISREILTDLVKWLKND